MHLEEHSRCRQECLLDALPRLGTSLKEPVQALLPGELFSLSRANLSLLFFVLLIAHQKDECVGFRLALDLLKPVLKIHKRVHRCHVIGQEDCVGPSVENFCYRLKTEEVRLDFQNHIIKALF